MQIVCGGLATSTPEVNFPNVDIELYNLAARCTQQDHALRPRLAELLSTVQCAVDTKTSPEHFPGNVYATCETDDYIRTYVWNVLLSATQLNTVPQCS